MSRSNYSSSVFAGGSPRDDGPIHALTMSHAIPAMRADQAIAQRIASAALLDRIQPGRPATRFKSFMVPRSNSRRANGKGSTLAQRASAFEP